ncbi:putative ATP-dependent RNA helicase TDRD12 [Octodon degus]|uniref:RNA helicase n=1 Tax=Octodon degus TaxID=10160 RepID=A0A6P6EXZ8_OCTDE|nr:putative ATP-dependent RNA helicase TDRD12 [Octodon degus]
MGEGVVALPAPKRVSAEEATCLQEVQQEDCGIERETGSETKSGNPTSETLSENPGDSPIGRISQPQLKSFHPQIKWFQKDDVIILRIRIRNIKDYTCKYFHDRVVFSAWVGDKFYLADMELQANIIKEDCKCVITNDEPVITLAKEKRGSWCGLLRQKNPNVTFDFDHWEECDEDGEEGLFPKVISSKTVPCKVPKVVEDSSSCEDDSGSESD